MYLIQGLYWRACVHCLGDLDFVSYGGTFPLPPINSKLTSNSSYFGESQGHLHFIWGCLSATSVTVYEMKSDCSHWFIKYSIHLAPISNVFPEMTQRKTCYVDGYSYVFAALRFRLLEDKISRRILSWYWKYLVRLYVTILWIQASKRYGKMLIAGVLDGVKFGSTLKPCHACS